MKVPGAIIIALALLIAVIPQLTTCEAEGKLLTLANGRQIPMKCTWTAQAELAMGGSLLVVGALTAVGRGKETRRTLAILGAVLGGFVALLPTVLIGVCTTMTANCNLIMRPSLILLGGLVMATSLVMLALSERRPEVAAERAA